MGFTKTESLLTEIIIQSEKQTEILEEIHKLLKPPVVLTASIPEENKKTIIKALESLEENKE